MEDMLFVTFDDGKSFDNKRQIDCPVICVSRRKGEDVYIENMLINEEAVDLYERLTRKQM